MQSEEGQDKQDADPIAPKETARRCSVLAPGSKILVSNVTDTYEMIWKHGWDTLLPAWNCSVHDTTECSGIPEEKERQV